MREKPDSGKESKDQQEPGGKRRLDLSVPQVAGSAIAAVVAAKLASNLGVYGTILGAGVVSALATCGGTVFQHFFRRTGEQIRDVTVQAKPKARQVPVSAEGPVPETFRAPTYPGAVGATGPVTTTWGRRQTDADADGTALLPTARDADPTAVLPAAGADPATVPPAPGDADATTMLPSVADADRTTLLPSVAPGADDDAERTRLLGAVDPTRALPRDDATRVLRATGPGGGTAPAAPLEPPLPSEEFTEGATHRAQIRSWKRPLIGAAVVFGIAMAGITTYEVFAGEDLSGGQGTTIGNGVSGQNSSPRKSPPPPEEPSGQPSDNGTPGTGDGSKKDGDNASQDPNGTGENQGDGTGKGNGTGQGSKDDPDNNGTGTDPDKDNGSDSGDDGSGTDPTPTPTPPTPTPTPSHGTGSDTDPQQGGTPTP
ncbi:hypothetical protein ABZ953_33135 [Streptomyces sp. NPDC046465]|uniref:hypothetical protein n=1 Tax=Streptomyces sp. NPDC046465 TaxID=3155810 RepID=UPI0033FDDF1C